MSRKIIVSPSILSADFYNLKEDIEKVKEAGAEWLHFDVMDGHFVPNISFGIPVLQSIGKKHGLVNDVHIMIENPKLYATRFVEAGADILTFHYEACKSLQECKDVIQIIHRAGAKAGISIKPKTDIMEIIPLLSELDLVLLMSVEPGFGGQEFIQDTLKKILKLKYYILRDNPNVLLEVDGGINELTGPQCTYFGADVLVAGSYLFGKEDIKERVENLKK